MDFTTDKLRSLVRKWQTLIEASVDVKTTDGYTLRMFCISFTKKRPGQIKRTAYAQTSQIRAIRKKMVDIMVREASSSDLKELVSKFIPEAIGKDIEKACQGGCGAGGAGLQALCTASSDAVCIAHLCPNIAMPQLHECCHAKLSVMS
jgi:hypothetical protein